MKTKLPCLSVGLLALLQVTPCSFGQVLIDNYPPSNDLAQSTVSQTIWRGFGFTTPSQGYNLTSATVRLASYSAADNDNISFGIYTGSTTAPNTASGLVGLFTDPAPNGGGVADFTLTPATSITLQPNTTYWLVASGENASTSIGWIGSTSDTPNSRTPTGAATFESFRASGNSGASWGAASATLNTVQVNATPVPEPSTYALAMGAGLVCFGAGRSWLRRQSRV